MSKSVARLWGKAPRLPLKKVKHEFPMPDTLMGIEVELERMGNPGASYPPDDYLKPWWTRTSDGSLRDGREFVLTEPLAGYDLSSAIHRLLSHDGFKRHPYGSTHIHMDMLEDNVDLNVLQTLVMLVYLFEDAIFALADPQREWCGFTNKLTTAPEYMLANVFNPQVMDESSAAFDRLHTATRQGERYYGLNMNALHKYGSIEFRYFPTAETADELIGWVSLIQSFRKAAIELGSLQAVERVIEDDSSIEAFVAKFFSDWQATILANVSSKKCRRMYEKALAHIPLPEIPQARTRRFNSAAITGRSQLAKFARRPERKLPEVSYNIVVVHDSNVQATPLAMDVPSGTILFHDGGVYYSYRNSWCRFHRSELNPTENATTCLRFAQVVPYCESMREQVTRAIAAVEGATAHRLAQYPDLIDLVVDLTSMCTETSPQNNFEDVE